MSSTYGAVPTTVFPSTTSSHNRITTQVLFFRQISKTPNRSFVSHSFKIRASSESGGEGWKWMKWLPTGGLAAEKVFRFIAGATASPIAQFIPSPRTFLHSVDARIKLILYYYTNSAFWVSLISVDFSLHVTRSLLCSSVAALFCSFFDLIAIVWLLALVVLPARAHITVRFVLVAYAALLSIWILPKNIWLDQLGRVSLLSGILFLSLGLGTDGAPQLVQPRTPPSAITGLPDLPTSLSGYSYLIMKLGPVQFTRKGLSVASTAACLTFIIFQSASLCLATTTPEQLAFALRWFMLPLRHISVPVAEMILTLMLSLRFINLVFDEVRNVALGIVSRRIEWQQLTVMETVEVFASYIRRIFKNIFGHAEQISQAMIVRGYRGNSSSHKIYISSSSAFGVADFVSLFCLVGVVTASVLSDYYLA